MKLRDRFKLWKYKRNQRYYDELTSGQSDYYRNKIKDIEAKE